MASKRRNMFQKNKTQETTENGYPASLTCFGPCVESLYNSLWSWCPTHPQSPKAEDGVKAPKYVFEKDSKQETKGGGVCIRVPEGGGIVVMSTEGTGTDPGEYGGLPTFRNLSECGPKHQSLSIGCRGLVHAGFNNSRGLEEIGGAHPEDKGGPLRQREMVLLPRHRSRLMTPIIHRTWTPETSLCPRLKRDKENVLEVQKQR
ncbi:hypothetical protein AAG570_006728 [Ranatra chinensis]|uniref:Uncharacterized protein n=1 Tax=Ranatra chinensis TaxID=642074 RepID=A0ABD0YUY5_9HEMI